VGGVGLYCAPVDGGGLFWGAGGGNYGESFAFDPQGNWLVWSTRHVYYHNPVYEGGLFARRTDGSGTSISLTDPPGMVQNFDASHPVVSSDGERVVFVQGGYDVFNGLMSVPIDRSQPPVALSAPSSDWSQVVRSYQITPDSRTALYVADLDVLGVFELYRSPLDASAPPARLGFPLPPFADFDRAFLVAPDGKHAFVLVDASRDGSLELWSFPVFPARGTEPILLSAKAVPGGGVAPGVVLNTEEYDGVPQPQFALSPDGTRLVYRADQDIDGVYEIYVVPSDGSAPAVKLNAPLAPGRSVPPFGFRFDPAGGVVVYAAPDGAGVMRLHAAPSDASSLPTALGGPFVAGGALWLSSSEGGAWSFEISPDGATVVYVADQRTDETIELFAAPLDGGPARVLNGALVPGGDVRALPPKQDPFALSPDGKRVAYLADQRTDEVVELFLSTIEPLMHVRSSRSPR